MKRKEKHRGYFAQTGIYLGKFLRMFIYQSDWKVIPMGAVIAGVVTYVVGQNLFVNQEGTLMGSFALVWGASEGVFTFIYFLGLALMVVLGMRANLHYMLAPIFMADVPEKSAWTCLKDSVDMMRRHVLQLFSLVLSFFLWIFLADIVVNLVASLSYGLAMLVNVAANVFITAYMNTTVCAYYEERLREKQQAEAAKAFSELEADGTVV